MQNEYLIHGVWRRHMHHTSGLNIRLIKSYVHGCRLYAMQCSSVHCMAFLFLLIHLSVFLSFSVTLSPSVFELVALLLLIPRWLLFFLFRMDNRQNCTGRRMIVPLVGRRTSPFAMLIVVYAVVPSRY